MKNETELTVKRTLAVRITKAFFTVLLIAIMLGSAVLAVFAIVSRIGNKKGAVFVFKFSMLSVISTSMEPLINMHDIIIIKKVKPEKLVVGDIITFEFDGNPDAASVNTHEIIRIDYETQTIVTKGINSSYEDAPITFDKVVGKVVFYSEGLGSFILFLQSPSGFFFLILIPLIALTLYETYCIRLKIEDYKLHKKKEEIKDPSYGTILELKKELAMLEKELQQKLAHKNGHGDGGVDTK